MTADVWRGLSDEVSKFFDLLDTWHLRHQLISQSPSQQRSQNWSEVGKICRSSCHVWAAAINCTTIWFRRVIHSCEALYSRVLENYYKPQSTKRISRNRRRKIVGSKVFRRDCVLPNFGPPDLRRQSTSPLFVTCVSFFVTKYNYHSWRNFNQRLDPPPASNPSWIGLEVGGGGAQFISFYLWFINLLLFITILAKCSDRPMYVILGS